MTVLKVNEASSRYVEGMRYVININGKQMFFTEKALEELGKKINSIQNTSNNRDYAKSRRIKLGSK